MRLYRPRRAGKRWREGAPEYILDCFDHPKETDRYTVMFWPEAGTRYDVSILYLGIDSQPASCFGEMRAHDAVAYRFHNHHRRIRWSDLPEAVRRHVIARYERS